jgi:hypothetical protein
MHRRERIFDISDIVDAVTIDAVGNGLISGREPFSMDTGQVLSQLVYALLRLESMHQAGVTMTAGTKFRHCLPSNLAQKSSRSIHRSFRIVCVAVPSVTIGATEAHMPVNIVGIGQRRRFQIVFKSRMTLNA